MKTLPTEKQMLTLLTMFAASSTQQSYVFTKLDVDLLCRHVRRTRVDAEYNDRFNSRNEEQLLRLTIALGSDFVTITLAHELQGVAYLWSQYKKPWLLRSALSILFRGVACFSFTGVAEYGQHTAPRYRVIGMQGNSFEYEAWSWQSGVQPKVISVAWRGLEA